MSTAFIGHAEVLDAILKIDLERRGLKLADEPVKVDAGRMIVVVISRRQCPVCNAPPGEHCRSEEGLDGMHAARFVYTVS